MLRNPAIPVVYFGYIVGKIAVRQVKNILRKGDAPHARERIAMSLKGLIFTSLGYVVFLVFCSSSFCDFVFDNTSEDFLSGFVKIQIVALVSALAVLLSYIAKVFVGEVVTGIIYFCGLVVSFFVSKMMLGDSMNNNASWGELYPDVDLINRGISGDTAPGILQRLGEVVAHNPEKLFLLTGPNDLINDKDLSIEDFWAGYEKLIVAVKEALPETEFYIQSILPMNPKSKFYEGYNDRAKAADEVLSASAQKYGYTYIDLVPGMVDGNGDLKDEYTSDGLHHIDE